MMLSPGHRLAANVDEQNNTESSAGIKMSFVTNLNRMIKKAILIE